ncbi:IS3 family transposase, partial [Vibrio sp. S11_S32]|uniref:IS3 family transposase n=1 Tax=Vibrio sp. S11_S32 TaxID=2720225 RepID=UPI001680EA1C
SRGSLGSRQLAKKLREEGFTIGRYRTRTIMRKLGLVVRQRRACLDNAVVERFFGSLKNEWLLNVVYLTRDAMKEDVEEYIRY